MKSCQACVFCKVHCGRTRCMSLGDWKVAAIHLHLHRVAAGWISCPRCATRRPSAAPRGSCAHRRVWPRGRLPHSAQAYKPGAGCGAVGLGRGRMCVLAGPPGLAGRGARGRSERWSARRARGAGPGGESSRPWTAGERLSRGAPRSLREDREPELVLRRGGPAPRTVRAVPAPSVLGAGRGARGVLPQRRPGRALRARRRLRHHADSPSGPLQRGASGSGRWRGTGDATRTGDRTGCVRTGRRGLFRPPPLEPRKPPRAVARPGRGPARAWPGRVPPAPVSCVCPHPGPAPPASRAPGRAHGSGKRWTYRRCQGVSTARRS